MAPKILVPKLRQPSGKMAARSAHGPLPVQGTRTPKVRADRAGCAVNRVFGILRQSGGAWRRCRGEPGARAQRGRTGKSRWAWAAGRVGDGDVRHGSRVSAEVAGTGWRGRGRAGRVVAGSGWAMIGASCHCGAVRIAGTGAASAIGPIGPGRLGSLPMWLLPIPRRAPEPCASPAHSGHAVDLAGEQAGRLGSSFDNCPAKGHFALQDGRLRLSSSRSSMSPA